MKKPLVIHPFLVGMFPIIFLLAQNRDMVVFSQILLPSAVVLGFTSLALLLLTLVLRESRKAGIVVSIFLILFFSYGHAFDLVGDLVEDQLGSDLSHIYLLAAWAILFIVSVYFAIRLRDPRRWTSVLNLVAIALIAPSLVKVGAYELRAKGIDGLPSVSAAGSVKTKPVEEGDEIPPDIYYIILDRYASSSTLREHFGVDNSEFTDYLTSKGFYVAAESRANYPKTFLSLASSLNMKHLTYLTDELGTDTSARTPVYPMLQDHEVWRFLKSRGYRFIHFGSSWGPTRRNRYADVNVTLDPAEFPMMLYRTTVLDPLGLELKFLDDRAMQRRAMLLRLRKLADVPDMEGGPKFVFAHLLLPHAPYLFGPEGEIVTEEEEEARTPMENYLNQLAFTNESVEELVDQILAKSDRPPIIILQADEGPFIPFLDEFGGAGTDWRKLSDGAVRTHMRILNAYYVPNADPEKILYPSITPVNSFRIIFDQYFGTDHGLVEDESYIFEDTLHPYTFINVTDRVSYH
jgi:hypothetical protein